MWKSSSKTDRRARLCAIAVIGSFIAMSGCTASTRVTLTQRSTIEQQLLVRSLERALVQIDTEPFKGKEVVLDVYGLTGDRDFAKEMLTAYFQRRGVGIAGAPDQADLRLKIFLNTLGVNSGETLLGIPAFAAPVINAPVPEIAFFKSVKNRGQTEIQIFAFDADSGDYAGGSPVAVGNAKYDDYTVLIVINFNLDDLDEPPQEEEDRSS